MPDDSDALDEALVMLAPYGPAYFGGLSNHGPMAAEALTRLGREDAVVPWTDLYRKQLEPAPPPAPLIPSDEQRAALGVAARFPEWLTTMQRALDEATWLDVVRVEVPKLIPGLFGAAAHGVIRTAHAVRALEAVATDERVDELARALAYWAACYRELPGDPQLNGRASIPEALAAVHRLDLPKAAGLRITEQLAGLSEVDGFPSAVDSLGLPVTADALANLTAAVAVVYLANAPHSAIALIHAVTGPAAVQLLFPYLDTADQRAAVAAAWRADAALVLAFAGNGVGSQSTDQENTDTDELVERAVASGDEHAIKFTEACLRMHARSPEPALLAAALDATTRLRSVF